MLNSRNTQKIWDDAQRLHEKFKIVEMLPTVFFGRNMFEPIRLINDRKNIPNNECTIPLHRRMIYCPWCNTTPYNIIQYNTIRYVRNHCTILHGFDPNHTSSLVTWFALSEEWCTVACERCPSLHRCNKQGDTRRVFLSMEAIGCACALLTLVVRALLHSYHLWEIHSPFPSDASVLPADPYDHRRRFASLATSVPGLYC